MSDLTKIERLQNMREYSEAMLYIDKAQHRAEKGDFGTAISMLQRALNELQTIKREEKLMNER